MHLDYMGGLHRQPLSMMTEVAYFHKFLTKVRDGIGK